MELGSYLSEAKLASLKREVRPQTLEDKIRGICSKRGVTLDNSQLNTIQSKVRENIATFIYISENGMQVMPMYEKSINFAKSVGYHLRKQDSVIWIHDCGSFKEVNYQNWKQVWNKITPKAQKQNEICQPSKQEMAEIREERRLDNFFNSARSVDLYKKLGKRGYNMTFDELKRKRQIEAIDRHIYNVKHQAEEIWEASLCV